MLIKWFNEIKGELYQHINMPTSVTCNTHSILDLMFTNLVDFDTMFCNNELFTAKTIHYLIKSSLSINLIPEIISDNDIINKY